MGLHLSRRGYSVRVEDMALCDSRFVIRAEITYAARLSEDERMRLSPLAQLDLLLGVEGAELRGPQARPVALHMRASRRAGLFGRGGQPGLATSPE
jgi:hypothetical protein